MPISAACPLCSLPSHLSPSSLPFFQFPNFLNITYSAIPSCGIQPIPKTIKMAPIKHILPVYKKRPPPPSGEPKHGHPPKHHTKTPSWITNRWRNELVAAAAEFAGTFMFLFFAFGGTSVANTAAIYADKSTSGQESGSITQAPNTSVLLYISLIFGFSLMVNVWVFFRVSGGLFNPAVRSPPPIANSK